MSIDANKNKMVRLQKFQMSYQDENAQRVARVRKCFSSCERDPATPRIPRGSSFWQPAYNRCTANCSQTGGDYTASDIREALEAQAQRAAAEARNIERAMRAKEEQTRIRMAAMEAERVRRANEEQARREMAAMEAERAMRAKEEQAQREMAAMEAERAELKRMEQAQREAEAKRARIRRAKLAQMQKAADEAQFMEMKRAIEENEKHVQSRAAEMAKAIRQYKITSGPQKRITANEIRYETMQSPMQATMLDREIAQMGIRGRMSRTSKYAGSRFAYASRFNSKRPRQHKKAYRAISAISKISDIAPTKKHKY